MTKKTMPKIRSLDAVILIADDFAKQRQFYKETMGLEVIEEYRDAVFFAIGKQKLAIFAKSHHPEGTERLGKAKHGISHLEFGIDKTDEKAAADTLKAAKAHVSGRDFEDADGNLFHFNFK
ncbi:MAG: glyoxalase/bleomycin resistance/dioxygenase family protein [Candidatus Melainabacteria bacterium]|nr:MAG: glyoxalase/bleomycin resistance/dioxygenase family protein [Candidatus Melainabacteria bacterium]